MTPTPEARQAAIAAVAKALWDNAYIEFIHSDPHESRTLEAITVEEAEKVVAALQADRSLLLGLLGFTQRCECMDRPIQYSNSGNPDHDGSPDECPLCYQGSVAPLWRDALAGDPS